MLPRITRANALAHYRVALEFSDGSYGVVDLEPQLKDRDAVFTPFHDPAFFAQVSVDHETGTIVWPNGADLDPDVLYALLRDSIVA